MSEFLNKKRTLDSYIEKKCKNSSFTRRNYQSAIRHFENQFLKEEYQDRKIDEIVQELNQVDNPQIALEDFIQDFVDFEEKKEIPDSSIRNRISIILGYFKYQRINFDKTDLLQNLSIKKTIKERKNPITKDQIKLILDNAGFKRRVYYWLMSSSGLRASEALGIRVKDIDRNYKRYAIHVNPEYSKTRTARITFCSREVMPLIDRIIEGKEKDDFIFPHNQKDRLYAVTTEGACFVYCKKKAGIKSKNHEITIHGLRAFFISAFEKCSSSFGHEFAGHSQYMDTYHRYTIEEKLEKYMECEKSLLIYSNEEPSQELDEIKQKLALFDKLTKNPKFQKLLEELD